MYIVHETTSKFLQLLDKNTSGSFLTKLKTFVMFAIGNSSSIFVTLGSNQLTLFRLDNRNRKVVVSL